MCFIKDKNEGTLLAQGIVEGGLYKLLSLDVFSRRSADCNSNLFKPSSMLSFCFDNKVVNSLPELNNHVSKLNNINTSETFAYSVYRNSSKTRKISVQLLHNRYGHPNMLCRQLLKAFPDIVVQTNSLVSVMLVNIAKCINFIFLLLLLKQKHHLSFYIQIYGD